MPHKYTEEQVKFLTDNVKGISNKELTRMFNERFNLNMKPDTIKSFKGNHKLSGGIDTRFKPGYVPLNKGMKGVHYKGSEKTWFLKGNKPHNYMPVGTERINGDGYIDVKIADPNKWKGKHILIYEASNGPVPKSHAVIFGDGNNRNFEPNNLILVSRKQLLTMNRYNLIKNDADLTKTGVIIADLYEKIAKVKSR